MLHRTWLPWLKPGSGSSPQGRRQRPARRQSFVPRLDVLEDRTVLTTFPVTTLADSGPGSLRQAILDANATPGDDTITFEVTGTINLASALPDLSSNIDLQGPGAGSLSVRRRGTTDPPYYRIFTVLSGASVVFSGLTITQGLFDGGSGSGGGIYNAGTVTLNQVTVSGNAGYGGGIYNAGTLTLDNSTVTSNGAYSFSGGGIYNAGTLTVNNSTVTNNGADGGGGGGIANAGTLTVNNSTISGNAAWDGRGGGGIDNLGGTLALNNSAVSGNSTEVDFGYVGVGYGAGILIEAGTVTLNNSTVSGNSYSLDAAGGGIWNTGTLTVNNSTISANSGLELGGIRNLGTLHARNTIIAGNSGFIAPDIFGNLGSLGHNLIGNTQGGSGFDPTDLLNFDPLLGPLQDNGGPTKTRALLANSPALNAGDPAELGVPDQRGVIRGGGVNIGAYQASASALVLTAPTTITAGTPFDLTVKAVDPFGQTAVGYTGTVHFSTTDAQAALPGDYSFTSSDAGVHTFSNAVTFKTAGSQIITATDTVTASIMGNGSVNVNPAAADHLVFLQQPTDTAAGQTISPLTVAVVDAFGNVETGDNSDTITLSLGTNPGGGTLSGTLTLTVVNGVATFSDLWIDLAGDGYTLHATTTGLTDADSVVFRIT